MRSENNLNKSRISRAILNYGVLFLAVGIFIVLSILQPQIKTMSSVLNILRQGTVIAIISYALMITVILGDFDISVTYNANLCGAVIMITILLGVNIWVAFLLGILASMLVSTANFFAATYIGIPSFVATIAMRLFLDGTVRGLTGGKQVVLTEPPPGFSFIGREVLFGIIPFQILFFIVLTIILFVILYKTKLGKYIHAVGESPDTALKVGIKTKKIRFIAYLICGVLLGLAGVVSTSMFSVSIVGLMEGYLMPVLTAIFLGASFLRGNRKALPNVLGTCVAAIILSTLSTGFTMIGAQLYVKDISNGLILITSIVGVTLMSRRINTSIEKLNVNNKKNVE